jgi:hypothetical protein
MKLGLNIMPLEAILYADISINDLAALQSPEVEATLHYLMQDPELKFCVVTSH